MQIWGTAVTYLLLGISAPSSGPMQAFHLPEYDGAGALARLPDHQLIVGREKGE